MLHLCVTALLAASTKAFVECSLSCAGIENDLRHLDNVLRQSAVARRILRDKLQQRGIAKVISTFEEHTPLRDIGMLHEMYSQGGGIACIEKIDRAAECRILDALMMRQVQTVGQRWLLDVALQPGPTGKSRFARDGELGIAELQLGRGRFPRPSNGEIADEIRGCVALLSGERAT